MPAPAEPRLFADLPFADLLAAFAKADRRQ